MEFFIWVTVVRHKAVGLVLGVLDAQRVAVDQVVDRLILDQQVGATDGIGLGVVFLAKQLNVRIRVLFQHVFFRFGQHAARACSWVINTA